MLFGDYDDDNDNYNYDNPTGLKEFYNGCMKVIAQMRKIIGIDKERDRLAFEDRENDD